MNTDSSSPTNPSALAYEHNGVRVSAQQFYAIACDPRRSVAVQACAGAGKTWMLVSRIVRALLQGSEPHHILAITFTKKAAGEMRQRLQDWLHEFAAMDAAQLQQELLFRGLSHSDLVRAQEQGVDWVAQLKGLQDTLLHARRPVQIRTFHGWFATLLRHAPVAVLQNLGLPLSYQLLEDDERLVQQVWRPFHAALLRQPEAYAFYQGMVLRHGRSNTRKALSHALERRNEFELAQRHGVLQHSVPDFRSVLGVGYESWGECEEPAQVLQRKFTQARWLEWAAQLGRCSGKTAPKTAQAIVEALEQHDGEALLEALRRALFVSTEDRLNKNLEKFEPAQAAQTELQMLLKAHKQHLAWMHQQHMIVLTQCLLQQYKALKQEQGWVDMGDVELAAQTMLSDAVLSGWVQEQLDAQVKHLLVDEFQDTNPLQWQALQAWLAGYGGAGHAPSVFIVGDPKQSIYRFRRAEPAVFRAAQRFVVEGLGGERLSCEHTRRNAPEVLQVVNAVMQGAQDDGQYHDFREHTTASQMPGQVLHLPAIVASNAEVAETTGQEEGASWRDTLTQARTQEEQTLAARECEQAGVWIQSLIQQGVPACEVMVLSRKRERLFWMQQALQALGIESQQPEKTLLHDLPEVQDIMALMSALVSPADNLSLARALKSALFGWQDADLVAFALKVRGQDPVPQPPVMWLHYLQDRAWCLQHEREDWWQLGNILSMYQSWLMRWPVHDALSALYQHADVLARYANALALHGSQAREAVLTNLRALLSVALEEQGARYMSAYGFVRAMQNSDRVAPVRLHTHAVQLLTIHGAKGLEASWVVLLDTDGAPPRAQSMGVLLDWPGESPAPETFIFLRSESDPPACVQSCLERELRERAREELNALYVAMTRAVQGLVLSSTQPKRASKELAHKHKSWWQRVQPFTVQAPLATPPTLSSPEDVSGAVQMPQVHPPSCDTSVSPPALHTFWRGLSQSLHPLETHPPSSAPVVTSQRPEVLPDASSLWGQAMHRLLEWLPVHPGGYRDSLAELGTHWDLARLESLAQTFSLSTEELGTVLEMARSIVLGEAAWVWDAHEVAWCINEVELRWQGHSLRVDRIVQRRSTSDYWVLDYKSSHHPDQDPALVQQLQHYVQAVQVALPLASSGCVRAAFLSSNGAWIPL